MINKHITSKMKEIVSLKLWEIGAIKVNFENPFKLVSGNYSPIYINCRLLISDQFFIDLFVAFSRFIIDQNNISIDIIAGGETAGIPFAANLARGLGLPMVYVRKAKKGHGLNDLIEGTALIKNLNVLLVEDLITDAGSKLQFIDAIKASGGVINNVLVIFDRLQGGIEALRKIRIKLYSLTDLTNALDVGKELNQISSEQHNETLTYLSDPERWHSLRELPYI